MWNIQESIWEHINNQLNHNSFFPIQIFPQLKRSTYSGDIKLRRYIQ